MSALRDLISSDLSSHIDENVVEDLLSTYDGLISKHRSGDFEGALTKAGRFVEHALRAIEYIRTGTAPSEIKSVAATVEVLRNTASLQEPLQLLIPRILYGMIYSIRSKRDAVHVKEIDPRQIDVAMSVSAASWVIAELIRLFHVSEESAVELCMLALSRTTIPFIETIANETIVGQKVAAKTEILLLLADASPDGLARAAIGQSAKCSPASVTTVLKRLVIDRMVHLAISKMYYITSSGESELASNLNQILNQQSNS